MLAEVELYMYVSVGICSYTRHRRTQRTYSTHDEIQRERNGHAVIKGRADFLEVG